VEETGVSGRLTGIRALVTGGDRGIGRAIVLGLASEGASVSIVYRTGQADAESLVAEVQRLGGKALALRADLSRAEQIPGVIDATYRQLGGLDVLVNNAGITKRQNLFDIRPEDLDEILAVNLKAPFMIAQRVARRMIATRTRGSIVNTTSISEDRARPGLVHYQASKGALLMLTRGLALELAPHGIRVNAVSPGLVETAMTQDMLADPADRAERVARIPLGRVGQPNDVAGAVVFLASNESSWITGISVRIDGGISVG